MRLCSACVQGPSKAQRHDSSNFLDDHCLTTPSSPASSQVVKCRPPPAAERKEMLGSLVKRGDSVSRTSWCRILLSECNLGQPPNQTPKTKPPILGRQIKKHSQAQPPKMRGSWHARDCFCHSVAWFGHMRIVCLVPAQLPLPKGRNPPLRSSADFRQRCRLGEEGEGRGLHKLSL